MRSSNYSIVMGKITQLSLIGWEHYPLIEFGGSVIIDENYSLAMAAPDGVC